MVMAVGVVEVGAVDGDGDGDDDDAKPMPPPMPVPVARRMKGNVRLARAAAFMKWLGKGSDGPIPPEVDPWKAGQM
jgi:hypothetical protein